MNLPISFPSQPHGYYSQINPTDQLPIHLEDHLKIIQSHLDHIQTQAQSPKPDLENIAQQFERFDQNLTQFFTELNKSPNRGFEKQIKDKFESVHHTFMDDLNEITDSHGTSLRDVLYDPQKFMHFLEQLHKSPDGKDSLQYLSTITHKFSQGLSQSFKI